MSDNKDLRGPQDASRINVNEEYEVRYWSQKFGITADELRKAVQQAGVSAKAVEEQLARKGRI